MTPPTPTAEPQFRRARPRSRTIGLPRAALLLWIAALLVGLLQVGQAMAAGASGATVVVGPLQDRRPQLPLLADTPLLGLQVGPRTRLLYGQETNSARFLPDLARQREEAANTVGLELRTSKPGRDLRQLLRVQLSSSSALHFRPRRSGLVVSYRAQFWPL